MARGIGPPPDPLPTLPELRLTARLATVHRHDLVAWRLSSHPEGRFNLEPPRGTCCAAEKPLGALIEVFGRLAILDPGEVARYRLSWLEVESLRIAEITDRRVLGRAGLTAELQATTDYVLTRRWAKAIADAGFEGVRYRARHDPAATLNSIALFGDRSTTPPAVSPPEPIGDRLLDAAAREFGLLAPPRRVSRRR